MINISAKNFDLTQGIKNHVEDKYEGLYNKGMNIIKASCTMEIETPNHPNHNNQLYKAEGIVEVKNKTLVADSTKNDMYAAIDDMASKINKQLVKYHDKVVDKHASNGKNNKVNNRMKVQI